MKGPNWSVSVSFPAFLGLSLCLSVPLFASLFVCLSVSLSVCLFVCLSVSVCLSVCRFLCVYACVIFGGYFHSASLSLRMESTSSVPEVAKNVEVVSNNDLTLERELARSDNATLMKRTILDDESGEEEEETGRKIPKVTKERGMGLAGSLSFFLVVSLLLPSLSLSLSLSASLSLSLFASLSKEM